MFLQYFQPLLPVLACDCCNVSVSQQIHFGSHLVGHLGSLLAGADPNPELWKSFQLWSVSLLKTALTRAPLPSIYTCMHCCCNASLQYAVMIVSVLDMQSSSSMPFAVKFLVCLQVAACICLFALDKYEAIPVDTHVWQLAVRYYTPHLKGTASLPNTKCSHTDNEPVTPRLAVCSKTQL